MHEAFRKNNAVLTGLSEVFKNHSSPVAAIVSAGGPGLWFGRACREFAVEMCGAHYFEGDSESPYPLLVPLRPFFNAIYFSMPEFSNYSGLDRNKIEKLSGVLGISADPGRHNYSVFDSIKSFYGFKHEWKEKDPTVKIFQEVANLLDYACGTKPVVFHIRNADLMDAGSAALIRFICKNLKGRKIFFILSHRAGAAIDAPLKKVFDEFIFAGFDAAADDADYFETVITDSAFKKKALELKGSAGFSEKLAALALESLNAGTLEVYKAAGIFYGDFRPGDIALCLKTSVEDIGGPLVELTEKGMIVKIYDAGVYRVSHGAMLECVKKATTAEESAAYNSAVIAAFESGSLAVPDIGLGRLLFHAFGAVNYPAAVKIARRLAVSLCDIYFYDNAVRFIRYIEYIIFNRAQDAIDEALKCDIYVLHGKMYLVLGRPERAYNYLNWLKTTLDEKIKSRPDLKQYAIEAYKWLGFILLLKPALAGQKQAAALKDFTYALTMDMADVKNRVECNNLIALYNYQAADLEKAGLFYRDNIKMLSLNKNDQTLWLEFDSTQRGLSSVYLRQGEFRKSLAYLKKCEESCAARNEGRMLANTFHYIGMIHHNRGEYNEAIEHYRKGIAVLDELNDRIGQSRILTSLGVTSHNLAKYEDALSYFNQSLEVALLTANKKAIAILKGNMAKIYMIFGNLDEAFEALREDIAIIDETGDKFGQAYAYTYLGDAYYMSGDLQKARENYMRANDIARKSQFLTPLILSSLGVILCLTPDRMDQDGKKVIDEVVMIDGREIDIVSKSLILRIRTIYEMTCGIYHRATCFINQALINFEKINMPLETALCLLDESKLLKLNGFLDISESKVRDALRIFENIGAKHYVQAAKTLI